MFFFSKINFQNTYVEHETPAPLSWKKILNFHFDYRDPSLSYTRERHSSLNSLFIVILVPESELLDELLPSYQSLSVATGYSMLVKLERSWRQISYYHLHPYFGIALFLFCVEKCSKVPWLQVYYQAFS